MTRISKIYVVSSMLAALALSANAAIAKGGNHGGGSSAGNAVTGTTNTSKQTAGTGAGKAKFNEFTIKKTTDSASPKLFKNAVKGTHYKQAKIVTRKAGGATTTSGTSYDKSGKGGSGNQPKESIEFNYGKVEYKY
jgi:type VI secretion system secreted protein Hcp